MQCYYWKNKKDKLVMNILLKFNHNGGASFVGKRRIPFHMTCKRIFLLLCDYDSAELGSVDLCIRNRTCHSVCPCLYEV